MATKLDAVFDDARLMDAVLVLVGLETLLEAIARCSEHLQIHTYTRCAALHFARLCAYDTAGRRGVAVALESTRSCGSCSARSTRSPASSS